MTLSETALEYRGTRWVHHGRDFGGLDCVGLVCVCIERVHGFTPPVPDYLRITHSEKMLDVCNRMFELVPLAAISQDCIAVLGFGRQRHMGIIGRNANGLTLIHAYLPNRKVVEVRLDDAWRSKVIAAYRVAEA